jgi:hypothetical protein
MKNRREVLVAGAAIAANAAGTSLTQYTNDSPMVATPVPAPPKPPRCPDCGGDCMSRWDFAENAAWNEAFGRSRDGR